MPQAYFYSVFNKRLFQSFKVIVPFIYLFIFFIRSLLVSVASVMKVTLPLTMKLVARISMNVRWTMAAALRTASTWMDLTCVNAAKDIMPPTPSKYMNFIFLLHLIGHCLICNNMRCSAAFIISTMKHADMINRCSNMLSLRPHSH